MLNLASDTIRFTLRPRNSLVLIRRQRATETAEGIQLPEAGAGDFDVAVIISVGLGITIDPGERVDTADLAPGQLVLIKAADRVQRPGKIAGTMQVGKAMRTLPLQIEGEDVELINQHDILAILEETTNEQT